MVFSSIIDSNFGEISIIWHSTGDSIVGEPFLIDRIFLSTPEITARMRCARNYPRASAQPPEILVTIIGLIFDVLHGSPIETPWKFMDVSHCSPFQQRVLRQEAYIPFGSVSTYHILAQALGKPQASRAVARALATNPFPLLVPCHRTIRSDGQLSGFQGGSVMKQKLLELEDVSVSSSHKILDSSKIWRFSD